MPADPFEEAYRAYLRSLKESLADVDVESVDLSRLQRATPTMLPSSHTVGTLWCMGHVGSAGCPTVGCFGTVGSVGSYYQEGSQRDTEQ